MLNFFNTKGTKGRQKKSIDLQPVATPPLTPPPKGRGTKLSFNLLIYSTLMKYTLFIKVLIMNKNHRDHIPLPFGGGVRGGVYSFMLHLHKPSRSKTHHRLKNHGINP